MIRFMPPPRFLVHYPGQATPPFGADSRADADSIVRNQCGGRGRVEDTRKDEQMDLFGGRT